MIHISGAAGVPFPLPRLAISEKLWYDGKKAAGGRKRGFHMGHLTTRDAYQNLEERINWFTQKRKDEERRKESAGGQEE